MLSKVGRKTFRVFAFDTETHNDKESLAKKETSIWLASMIDETSKWTDADIYFYNLVDFLNRLKELSRLVWHDHKRNVNNILIYDYNLAFEWSFLLPVMLKYGFKYKDKIEDDDEYVFNSVTNKTCASVWQAELKFEKKSGQVIFRDLSKIFPGGLASVAKSFHLETQKGEIDYTKNRLHNYKIPDYEKRYNFNDNRIIIDILLKIKDRDDKEFWKSCSAATYSCRKMIKAAYPFAYKPMKVFRKYYPELDQVESEFLRNGIAGGITYAPARFQFKDIDQTIGHLDIHQAHPFSGYSHIFPYGKGTYFKGEPPKDHFYICCCHVKVSYSGVILHSVIKLIGIDIATDVELTLWDFELRLMFKCYENLEVTYIDGYAYRGKFLMWRDYYLTNYKKRMIAKKEHDDFNIMYYKLLNNSSYGKLLEHGHEETFENVENEDGIIDSVVHKRDHASINATYTYLPAGSCIPAWTRVYLVSSALTLSPDGSKIVYFDTDSIFFLKDEETIKNMKKLHIGDNLGDFGIEKDIKRGQFTAPKRYKIQEIQEDGSTEDVFHLAGVNFKRYKELPTYDNLNIVCGHYAIQGVMRVKGGTIVVTKDKDLGIQKKYSLIAKANLKSKNKLENS